MKYAAFLNVLSNNGVNVDTFDSLARKPLHFLYKEVCEKDCRLVVSNGRVYRTAVSVKLYIRTANAYWLETAREYANGPVAQRRIEKVQSHTLSETMTAGEKPLNCVLRCLAEEPGIVDVNPAELKDVSIFGEVDIHESSVYPGVISVGPIFRYEWVATEPVFPRYSSDGGSTQRVSFTDDNGVRLFVTKFSL